jgi:general secretion pathway protein J
MKKKHRGFIISQSMNQRDRIPSRFWKGFLIILRNTIQTTGFTPYHVKPCYSERRCGSLWKYLPQRKSFVSTWGAGFTLIEVVVTLTVLGFILLMIFGAFRLGLSAWERGESTKEEYQQVRIISQLISQQIKSMVPYKIKTKKAEGDYLAFEGKPRSLKFVSALSLKTNQPEGFVYAIYEFREGNGEEGGRLVLYEQRALNRDFFEDQIKEEMGISLLEGVTNVQFEFYQAEDSDKNLKEGWIEEWNAKETKEFPKALKMTISKKNGKDKGKELPITIVTSLPANRFEETRVSPTGIGRRTIQQRLRP